MEDSNTLETGSRSLDLTGSDSAAPADCRKRCTPSSRQPSESALLFGMANDFLLSVLLTARPNLGSVPEQFGTVCFSNADRLPVIGQILYQSKSRELYENSMSRKQAGDQFGPVGSASHSQSSTLSGKQMRL